MTDTLTRPPVVPETAADLPVILEGETAIVEWLERNPIALAWAAGLERQHVETFLGDLARFADEAHALGLHRQAEEWRRMGNIVQVRMTPAGGTGND